MICNKFFTCQAPIIRILEVPSTDRVERVCAVGHSTYWPPPDGDMWRPSRPYAAHHKAPKRQQRKDPTHCWACKRVLGGGHTPSCRVMAKRKGAA